ARDRRGRGPRGSDAVHRPPVQRAAAARRCLREAHRRFPAVPPYQDDVYAAVEAAASEKLYEALTIAGKQERDDRTDEIKVEVLEQVAPNFEGREKEIGAAFRSLTKKLVRQRILRDQFRIDGRGVTDIRALSAEV